MSDEIAKANRIACHSWELARWAHRNLDAMVSIENPANSYLWQFLEREFGSAESPGDWSDTVLSMCQFGTSYRKETRLRSLGIDLTSLGRRCVLRDGWFSCGRALHPGHDRLEFGGSSTASAARYPEALCTEWAQVLVDAVLRPAREVQARAEVRLTGEGRVHRHVLRGQDPASALDLRKAEDASCQAGLRNAALVFERWPSLATAMAPVEEALREARAADP